MEFKIAIIEIFYVQIIFIIMKIYIVDIISIVYMYKFKLYTLSTRIINYQCLFLENCEIIRLLIISIYIYIYIYIYNYI